MSALTFNLVVDGDSGEQGHAEEKVYNVHIRVEEVTRIGVRTVFYAVLSESLEQSSYQVVARDRSLLAEFLVDALFKYFIVHRRYTAQTLNFRARYLLAAELYFFSLVLYSSDLIHSTLTKKMNTVLRHKIREREREQLR